MTENHFDRLLRLLELEAQAEAEQLRVRAKRMSGAEAEQLGNTLVEMACDDETVGLGGRRLLTFCKRNRTLRLPWTRLGRGTPVLLSAEDEGVDVSIRGIVADRMAQAITVACGAAADDIDRAASWRIDYASDETARDRQRAALRLARSAERGRITQWRKLLVGEKEPKFHEPPEITPLSSALNESQLEAVRFALSADNLAIIHGPPGTGKTTTLVELIRQAVRRGEKVLATAPSNMGVDNLLEKLAAADLRVVRLGHPARVAAALREHTLDYLLESHPDMDVAVQLLRNADKLFRRAGRFTRAKPAPGEKQALRAEARQLQGEARRIERTIEAHLLDRAEVVCATLTGLDDETLGDREFDWCIVDEAAQATEPPCWIPLARSKRLVLAGDHCQLPPTIVSTEAAQAGFGRSLMERIIADGGRAWSRMLSVQYRMHEAIAGFSSREFYEGRLTADPSVAGHRLSGLPNVAQDPPADERLDAPLEFIDTAGAGYEEEQAPDGESRYNRDEARRVVQKVRQLLAAGVESRQLAVIAPYAAQVRLLRELLGDVELEIDSVDGFQGREKEAVVVSLVRGNAEGEIGFLADVRRMNVALTRARRKLIVVGDSATIGGHPFYRDLLEYVERFGRYGSIWEEPE